MLPHIKQEMTKEMTGHLVAMMSLPAPATGPILKGDEQTDNVFDLSDMNPGHAKIAESKANDTAIKATYITKKRMASHIGGGLRPWTKEAGSLTHAAAAACRLTLW